MLLVLHITLGMDWCIPSIQCSSLHSSTSTMHSSSIHLQSCLPNDCHHLFHISIGEDVALLASGVVFVDTGLQAHETASDMVSMMRMDGDTEQVTDAVTDPDVCTALSFRVAYYPFQFESLRQATDSTVLLKQSNLNSCYSVGVHLGVLS